jgi:predicted DNA-binding transcriptional regulator YafY
MRTEKLQRERLSAISERLTRWAGAVVGKKELMEVCECRERTLKGDISYINQQYSEPVIVYDRKRKGYTCVMAFDLKAEVPLSSRDLHALEGAAATLRQFSHLEIFRDLRTAIDKIEKAVQFRFQNKGILGAFLEFEQGAFFRGDEHFGFLLNAIRQNQTIGFEHKNFDDGVVKKRWLKPYLVKEYRNRWYVIGFDGLREGVRIFGLDRILPGTLHVSKQRINAPEFDARAYFRNSIGIAAIQELEPESVVLSFTAREGRYFKAQPFFPFQEEDVLIDSPEEFRVRLHIVLNRELLFELARRGREVQVIEPKSLKEELLMHYREAINRYE